MAGATSVDLAAKINVDHSSTGMQHSGEVLPLRTLVHRLLLHHLDSLCREEEQFSLQSPSREFPV